MGTCELNTQPILTHFLFPYDRHQGPRPTCSSSACPSRGGQEDDANGSHPAGVNSREVLNALGQKCPFKSMSSLCNIIKSSRVLGSYHGLLLVFLILYYYQDVIYECKLPFIYARPVLETLAVRLACPSRAIKLVGVIPSIRFAAP